MLAILVLYLKASPAGHCGAVVFGLGGLAIGSGQTTLSRKYKGLGMPVVGILHNGSELADGASNRATYRLYLLADMKPSLLLAFSLVYATRLCVAVGPVLTLPIVDAAVTPDGYTRQAVLPNGTFPGPLISGNKVGIHRLS